MNNDLILRRLTPEDATVYRALRLLGLQESSSAFGASFEEESKQPLSFFAARLAPAEDACRLGAFDAASGALLGTATLLRESHRKSRHKALLVGVLVHPQRRGQGLGRALLDAALAQARAWPGLRCVLLCVNAANAPALALYHAAGFQAYGREPESLCVDGRFHDEVLMRLPL